MKTALFCLALLAATGVARADEKRTIDVVSASLAGGGAELQLSFLDRDPVPHDCDYFVSRFEYVSSVEPGLLLVELKSPEPCLVDRIGRRTGSLKWGLPGALRGAGRLTVIVNDQDLGELQVSGTEVSFVPSKK
jgi:hypothetical protein